MVVDDAPRLAREAFAWVASVAVDTPHGPVWCEDGSPSDDLYSGTAGVLLACAEAAKAGLDVATVAAGAVQRLRGIAADPSAAVLEDDSLFGGWSGVAVALRAWAAVADDATLRSTATEVLADVARRVVVQPPSYLDVISGDAGVLLALLSGAGSHDAAGVVADRLIAAGEPTDAGLRWRMRPSDESLMPGFSHGTAGVAHALASAAQVLDRPDLLDVARAGATELLHLSGSVEGGAWAVPLIIPPQAHRPPVYFGWCHGAAGTARLFALLERIDPDPRWSAAVAACVQALRDSRLPERLYPGYWDNIGRCCGSASVGQFLLDRVSAGDGVLDFAEVIAADVMARAVAQPVGLAWSNTEHTASPPELPPQPGFMQGAAGIAAWLARLDAARRGQPVRAAVDWV